MRAENESFYSLFHLCKMVTEAQTDTESYPKGKGEKSHTVTDCFIRKEGFVGEMLDSHSNALWVFLGGRSQPVSPYCELSLSSDLV